jgi:hypothetical protein
LPASRHPVHRQRHHPSENSHPDGIASFIADQIVTEDRAITILKTYTFLTSAAETNMRSNRRSAAIKLAGNL